MCIWITYAYICNTTYVYTSAWTLHTHNNIHTIRLPSNKKLFTAWFLGEGLTKEKRGIHSSHCPRSSIEPGRWEANATKEKVMRTRGRSLHSLQIKPWAPLRTETAALWTELDSQPEADKLKLLERTETAFIFFSWASNECTSSERSCTSVSATPETTESSERPVQSYRQ